MPLYVGNQKIKDVYVGSQKIKEAHVHDGAAWKKVYTSVLPALHSDNFNDGSTGFNTRWTRRNGTTNPAVSLSRVMMSGYTDGYYPANYNQPVNTADQYVEVDAYSVSSVGSIIFLRASLAGEGAYLLYHSGGLQIITSTSWSSASATVRQSGTTGPAAGNRVRFTAQGNVYTGYINGVQRVQWVDTEGIVPTTGRYGGLAVQRGSFTNSGEMDNWTFGDL